MNNTKKTLLITALGGLGVTSMANAATLIVNTVAPAGLAGSDQTGTINSNMLDEDANANHGRADSFTLGTSSTGSFDITSVTLAKNGNQTFVNDSVIVFIASGGSTAWDAGTGHNTADDGVDFLVDTGMTLQVQESFTLNGLITGAQFMTFEFTTPIALDDATEYTVGWVYYQAAGANPDRLGYDENGNGGRLSVNDGAYGAASTRGINFSVQGAESIPEPSSTALLGLGGLALILRRRK